MYYIDGLISLDRAQLFGDILRNMTVDQKSALDHLATLGDVGNWPQNSPDPLQGLHLDPDVSVGVTYASEMYSWYAGSVEADTYFCPERQGTYFGSFYLKDAPAIGNTNYTIDPNLTADAGDAFLDALTASQRQLVTNLVVVQKPYLYDLVEARSNISIRLRQLMITNAIDTNAVLDLCRHYGELDGMIVYSYATYFSRVGQSLTTNQQADGGEMTWENAAAYADSLSLGGYTDWRLPTAHELFGIVNHASVNPAMDTAVFTATTAEYWWT